MLKGGGALNPDGLALDLAFALDRSFTTDPAAAGGALITSRRGPAAKFSRGSGATQVNAAGLIEYAPENLILRSEGMPTLWNPVDSSISPDVEVSPSGLTNADKLVENSLLASHRIEQPFTPISSTTYTASIFVKPAERNFVLLGFTGGSMATTYVSANLSAETVSTAIGTPIASSITKFANGWYRVSITLASTGVTSSFFDVRISTDGVWANRSYLGDGTSGIFLWGAQLERASTARTYYPTTTSVFYGPRFDYDPATLASKGLLIEETRTNLLLRSESFEATSWIKGGPQPAVITADNIISPSGTLTADTLAMPAIALNQYSLAAQQFSGTAVPYTLTFYVKSATGGQTIWASLTPDGVNYFRQSIILTTEWQRVSLTATLTATQWSAQIGIDRRDLSQTGTGGFEFHVWGAQLEAGAFPLSYIPTTSGTAIRSADVCSITGTDFDRVYNQSELSIYSEVSFAPASAGFPVISFNNQTAAERVELAAFAGPIRLACFVVQNGTTQAAPNIAASANQFHKAALYAKLNSFQFALNGSLATKDTVGLMPTATRLNIGKQFNEVYLNGHLKQVTIYRKALTDAKLQTLTAP
jgi:hypothetical protein